MTFARSARSVLVLATLVASLPAAAAGAKADLENGKTIFTQRCGICHAVSTAPGGPVAGPSMVGIVGRKAATAAGFAMYTEAMKKSGLTWNVKSLNEFLIMPMQKVPGTTMPMMLPDDKERGDVIAYMGTLKAGK
jgi:cytochrome c